MASDSSHLFQTLHSILSYPTLQYSLMFYSLLSLLLTYFILFHSILIQTTYTLCKQSYLISMGMSTNDNWLIPPRNQSWYSLAYDWFSEHSATKDITNSTIWTPPHLLQLELWKMCPQYIMMTMLYAKDTAHQNSKAFA